MKSSRSESGLTPRSFPDIKKIIQNAQLQKGSPDPKCKCQQGKMTNRQVGTFSSSLLGNNCCCNKFQQPIILQKRSRDAEYRTGKKAGIIENVPDRVYHSPKTSRPLKVVEKFQPITIPTPDKKLNIQSRLTMASNPPKKIQIHLQNNDKDCLKKLFKKINSLTDQLHQADKKNSILTFELDHLKGVNKKVLQLEKENAKLKEEIGKLRLELSVTVSKTVQRVIERPVQIIKHVPVEKIVEVQVPRYIPGPQRLIQKVIQVAVQRKVPYEVVKEVFKQSTRPRGESGMIPDYKQPPIYHALSHPYGIPIQVPVPVYIDRPHYSTDRQFMETRTTNMSQLHRQNQYLNRENSELSSALQILKQHHKEKNREMETLIYQDFQTQQISPGIPDYQTYATNVYWV